MLVFSLLFIASCSENYADKAVADSSTTSGTNDFKLASVSSAVLVEAAPEGELGFAQTESIGGLGLGMTPKQFVELLPCTVEKSEPVLWAGIGEIIQEWNYADCGISLKLSASDNNTPQKILSIRTTAPSEFKTNRKIGIGSTFEQVIDAYTEYADQADNQAGETFLAGSVYGGLSMEFEKNRVVSLFLGAGAE